MKVNENIAAGDLPPHLMDYLRSNARKVNALAGGAFSARENTATAAPTTGTWAQGDQVANSNPIEAGAAASKYVIVGWICTVGGNPGTWLAMRTLTGN